MLQNTEVTMKRKSLKIFCFMLTLFCFSSVFYACDIIEDHKIFVTSSDISIGTTTGGGTYKTNYDVTLEATPKFEDNKFLAWIKDGFVVSQENPYTFVASKATEGKYTAIFNDDTLELLQLTNISFMLGGLPYGVEQEKIVSDFSDITISVGTNSDVYSKVASALNISPVDGIVSTNEFIILPYVFDKTKDYYIKFSTTAVITDSLDETQTEKKYPTQFKVEFEASENSNLTIVEDNNKFIVTRKNLTVDNTWLSGENIPNSIKLIFEKFSFEEDSE